MLAHPVVHHIHHNGLPTQQHRHPPHRPQTTVLGIPSVTIQNNRLVVGNSQSSMSSTALAHPGSQYICLGSTRSYTTVKVLGDGSFGTVSLCDWHGTLPPGTPLSPMQCGAGARPDWAGMRLVAVKRMRKKWEGGWDECQKLKELEVRIYPAFFSLVVQGQLSSPCAQSPFTPISFPSTTFFSSQNQRSSTLSSSPWRETCTISSKPARVVCSQEAWYPLFSAKSSQAWIISTLMDIFIEI